jgi:hypothetical protein
LGLCLGEQRVGLGLERLHGVGAGGEAGWRLLDDMFLIWASATTTPKRCPANLTIKVSHR